MNLYDNNKLYRTVQLQNANKYWFFWRMYGLYLCSLSIIFPSSSSSPASLLPCMGSISELIILRNGLEEEEGPMEKTCPLECGYFAVSSLSPLHLPMPPMCIQVEEAVENKQKHGGEISCSISLSKFGFYSVHFH